MANFWKIFDRLRLRGKTSDPSDLQNGQVWYNDTEKKVKFFQNDSITELSKSNDVNYLIGTNSDFETSIGNYSAYQDASDPFPVDGTGGSPTVTITRTTSSPLRDSASGLITKDASNRRGEGVSTDFTIQDADLAQVLRISFDYKVASGTFSFGDGTVATPSDIRVFIYDVTNSALIEPTQTLLDGSGKFISEFQTSPDSTSYRLILHVATTSASAWTFKFDNVQVGPRELARGPIAKYLGSISGWTVSNNGSKTFTISNRCWRIGNRLVAEVTLDGNTTASGSAASDQFQLNLPSGYSIDTAKISGTVGSIQARCGTANYFGVASVFTDAFSVGYPWVKTATGVVFSREQSSTVSAIRISDLNNTNNADIYCTLNLPIVGWEENTVTSSDSGTRVVAFEGVHTAGATINTSSTVIPFTVISDTHGGWSTDSYTIKESGFYSVSARATLVTTNLSTSQRFNINVTVDSVTYRDGTRANGVGASQSHTSELTFVTYFRAGQVLQITGISSVSGSLSTSAAQNFFCINKIQSPQSIGMADRVGCKYTSATTTVGTSTGTVVYPTKVYDYTNSYNTSTGAFTCPIAGIYHVIGTMSGTTQSSALNTSVGLRIAKGGVEQYSSLFTFQVTSTNLAIRQQVSVMVYANAGETLSIQCNRSASVSSFSLNGADTDCTMMITRIA